MLGLPRRGPGLGGGGVPRYVETSDMHTINYVMSKTGSMVYPMFLYLSVNHVTFSTFVCFS